MKVQHQLVNIKLRMLVLAINEGSFMIKNILKFGSLGLLTTLLFTGCGIKKIPNVQLDDNPFISKDYAKSMDGNNNLAFAYAEPKISVRIETSDELRNGLKARLKYVTKQLKCHLNSELDKVIVSKGFTITNKYRSYKYMTFTEKRNTSALFYPEIRLTIKERSEIQKIGRWRWRTEGDLEIEAEVNIVMLEPLSNEIIWIKSIPVESATSEDFQYENAFAPHPIEGNLKRSNKVAKVSVGKNITVPLNLKHIAIKLDNVYKEIDAKIIEATQTYIEEEELSFLNTDIKKLKKIKRY